MLWNGTAASFVDLNPIGFGSSYALGTNGSQQVGYGLTTGGDHALLWNGTAASVIDLGALLAPDGLINSQAFSISGNQIYGIADDSSGNTYAIVWTVPKPASLTLLGLGGAIALQRLRRRK